MNIYSPAQFGKCDDYFDITLVDEAHLLKVGITGTMGQIVREIDAKLFNDGKIHSELDWIMAKSDNVVLVYSPEQRIRPANITPADIKKYEKDYDRRNYYLKTQMRSRGGKKYIDYIHDIFSNNIRPQTKEHFDGFEAKIFSDIHAFSQAMDYREMQFGLARKVAGFAWKWGSKKNKSEYDIYIDDMKFRWNSTQKNWIGSKNAPDEVGSIYTVQGDDLNYVGIIIGNDLIYRDGKLKFNRKACADSGAMKRSQRQVVAKDKS